MAYNYTIPINCYCSFVMAVVWLREHWNFLSNDKPPHFFVYVMATNYAFFDCFTFHS